MSINSVLRLRQDDCNEFEASLGYTAHSMLSWDIEQDPVSKQNRKHPLRQLYFINVFI